MTEQEFDIWQFDKNQTVCYNGEFYPIFAVDFGAYLIAFKKDGEIYWKHCTDVIITPF